jgi:hypothetical protein
MTEVGGDMPNGYSLQAVIAGDDVYSAGMAWYVEAVDGSDNVNVGCSPDRCDEDPYRFAVVDD